MENLLFTRNQLENHFDGIFRKIWVQRSTQGSTILLTLFNQTGYETITLRNLRLISFEEILSRLENNSVINRQIKSILE